MGVGGRPSQPVRRPLCSLPSGPLTEDCGAGDSVSIGGHRWDHAGSRAGSVAELLERGRGDARGVVGRVLPGRPRLPTMPLRTHARSSTRDVREVGDSRSGRPGRPPRRRRVEIRSVAASYRASSPATRDEAICYERAGSTLEGQGRSAARPEQFQGSNRALYQ